MEDELSTNTPNFEVPPDMRAFAEKSVEQARVAFDSFISAAQRAVNTAQAGGAPGPARGAGDCDFHGRLLCFYSNYQ